MFISINSTTLHIAKVSTMDRKKLHKKLNNMLEHAQSYKNNNFRQTYNSDTGSQTELIWYSGRL